MTQRRHKEDQRRLCREFFGVILEVSFMNETKRVVVRVEGRRGEGDEKRIKCIKVRKERSEAL